MTINVFPSFAYAVDSRFGDDFWDEIYDDDYLFEFISESDNDFWSDDIDFNAGSEEPDEDIGDIFGDLFWEVEDIEDEDFDFNDDFWFDDIDFNAASEDPDDDISDIFGNLLWDIDDDDIIDDTSMNVEPQLYPNCKAIDDMLYGYSMVNISKFIDIDESLYKNDIIDEDDKITEEGKIAIEQNSVTLPETRTFILGWKRSK
mgnify:CR=1 FL=1